MYIFNYIPAHGFINEKLDRKGLFEMYNLVRFYFVHCTYYHYLTIITVIFEKENTLNVLLQFKIINFFILHVCYILCI